VSPTESPARATDGVQVIARAAEILRLLQASPGGLAQAEIAERIGLARTTVRRILGALEAEALVTSSGPRTRYRLGAEIPRLAEAARHALVIDLRPYLEELSRSVNETVDLSVLEGDHVLFIGQVVAPHRLRAVSAVGAAFPTHCCANGKALLARLPDEETERMLPDPLPSFTPKTITARARLSEEIGEIRRTGVAFDREEHTEGISAVGAVVSVPALVAISIPLPTQRFTGREDELAAALTEMTARVESIFSGPPLG
jgi:DNA-binding IclR family transcriptional regulator